MPLSRDRNTPIRNGDEVGHPVRAGAHIYAGALVVLEAGYAVPGHEATGLIAIGRSDGHYDNRDGLDGDQVAQVRCGIFRFQNDDASPIERSHIGQLAYIVDDQTVSASDGSAARSVAGRVFDLEPGGVWIHVGPMG